MFYKGQGQLNSGKTWWRKGHKPWNLDKKISLKPKTGWNINCKVCGKEKYYQLNEHKKRIRVYCSPECYQQDARKKVLVYSAVHNRVRTDWGKAIKCETCTSEKNIDWANLDGEYSFDRNTWKQLCRKCHIKYDKKFNSGKSLIFKSKKI